MKNIARLLRSFSLCFTALFLSAVLIRYLHIRIEALRFLTPMTGQALPELLSAVQWALPVTIYTSLLLGLSYSIRRRIPFILTMIILVLLTGAFSAGICLGTDGLTNVSFLPKNPKLQSKPGLILTQGDNRYILLGDAAETEGPRVVSLPGQPLIYQESPAGPDNTVIPLPPAPFRTTMDWILQSLTIDFSLTGRELARRFKDGLEPFLIYGLSLVFLLVNLRFILNLSNWPLANLFLGALAFRGILSLETFLNSEQAQTFLIAFLADRVPTPYITPLIFCTLAVLVCLYAGLNWLTLNIQKANDGY
ncbi:hypothetical protein FACS189462_5290 [Spirochaetia bacterium]|nr:hypothetical protein FACS189462_5290 [Spirochaetia bacterium]